MPSWIPWTLSLVAVTLIYFVPLNFFLARGGRAVFVLSTWSLAILAASWSVYAAVPREGFGSSGLFITLLVFFSVVLHWMAARFGGALEGRVAPERAYGWILFGAILSLAAVVSVPLCAALLSALTRSL
jgi:uncharacterized membrane protein